MTTIPHTSLSPSQPEPPKPLRNRFQVKPHIHPHLGEQPISKICSECHQKKVVGAFSYHETLTLPNGTSATITTADLIDYAQDCGWDFVAGWLICPDCLGTTQGDTEVPA